MTTQSKMSVVFAALVSCHVGLVRSVGSEPRYREGASLNQKIITDWAWATEKTVEERAEIDIADLSSDTWCADYGVCDLEGMSITEQLTAFKEAVINMETKNDRASFAGLAHRDMTGRGAGFRDYGSAVWGVTKDALGITAVQRKARANYQKTSYKADIAGDACIKKYGKGSRRCTYERAPVLKIYDIVDNMSVEAQKQYATVMENREYDDDFPIED